MERQTLGRYEILGELGRGAMGVVYKAIDPSLNRTVAIKTIRLSDDLEERDEYEARFKLEAKAAGSVNHPAIVTIYELGSSGDVAYMAMEFLDGRELRAMLADGGTLPVRETLAIAGKVADGLGAAHRHGIVHRDIKPANIIVLKDGGVKITDFGIARMRVSDVKTQTGTRLGSPKYMSPEQVLGQRTDHRADIFSLGIVLYEMLTGRAPFGGESLEGLMYQTVNLMPPAPSRINPEVPEMLDLIIAKALAKRPDDRYQDASSMAHDLRECGQSLGVKMPDVAEVGAPDDHEATIVLKPKEAIRSRRGDEQEDAVGGQRMVSPLFDSFEATRKLAANTGADREIKEHSTTIRLGPATVATPAPVGAMARPVGIESPGVAFGIPEWGLAAAILLIAVAVAALIAFA